MDLATIDMPAAEARARLAEYQQVLHTERTAQDVVIAMALRAIARGMPVIRLSQSVAAGGFFDNSLPKIAVVRADAASVTVRWQNDRDLVYYGPDGHLNLGALVGKDTVRVHVAKPPSQPLAIRGRRWAGSTIAPLVPPRCRPKLRRLPRCHLLWEVEEWDSVPPRDPALIRHIHGDLWAVLAVWDLTELERAVLAM